MKYTIFFATGGLEITKPADQSSLGGSESALYFMAKELAKRGHTIKVFCRCGDTSQYMEGVEYIPVELFRQYTTFHECDIFVVHRAFSLATTHVRSKTNWIWHHDILTNKETYASALWQTEKLLFLSEYHQSLYTKQLPPIEKISSITRNGVDYEGIKSFMELSRKKGVKKPYSFVYTSRPERGLHNLLGAIWPRIVAMYPEATLDIAYYQLPVDMKAGQPQEVKDVWDFCDLLMKEGKNITYHGGLEKRDLYHLYATSECLLYPTTFPEVSFIGCMEAMSCRTTLITTDGFAIPECAGNKGEWKDCDIVPAQLIGGKPGSLKYQDSFIDAVCAVYSEPELTERMRDEGQRRIETHYRWDLIAKEWEESFDGFFEERYSNNKDAIVENLFYHDDVVALKESCHENGNELHDGNCKEILASCEKRFDDALTGYAINTYNERFTHAPKGLARFARVIDIIKEHSKQKQNDSLHVLDGGCAGGDFMFDLKARMPDVVGVGIDASPDLIKEARKYTKEYSGVSFLSSPFGEYVKCGVNKGVHDVAFCGEFLEHMRDTLATLEGMERITKDGGLCVLTVPSGPWENIHTRLSHGGTSMHVRHFEENDIKAIFGSKNGFGYGYLLMGGFDGSRGEQFGNWVIWWTKDDKIPEFGKVDYIKKVKTTRPYQSVSACLIVKNEEDNISRCLKSIEHYVDQIVIVDTGSTDDTEKIAKKFLWRPGDVYEKMKWEGDFSKARNRSIESAIGRWILWIDADEVLVGGSNLRKYLDDAISEGCVIRQHHLMIDVNIEPDTPARVFKNNQQHHFKGKIHEQVEMGGPDEFDVPLEPTIILRDVSIAHFGYICEADRRAKCSQRNLGILLRDRAENPQRKLGLALLMRDYTHLFEWNVPRGTIPTPEQAKYLTTSVDIYQQHFNNGSKDIYHRHTTKYYQKTLELMGQYKVPSNQTGEVPIQVSQSLAVGVGGLNGNQRDLPDVSWILGVKELHEVLNDQVRTLRDGLGDEWKEQYVVEGSDVK